MNPASKQSQFDELRNTHPVFVYHGYHVSRNENALKIVFDFEVPGLCEYHPEITYLPKYFINTKHLSDKDLENLAFHIGMVELVSYWKASCCPSVIIKPFKLDSYQIAWWKKLYFHGLGEFFYLNGIETNMQDFMELSPDSEKELSPLSPLRGDGTLVPVGGGKDSVVSMELIKEGKISYRPYIINPRGATISTANIAGYPQEECLIAHRRIDKQLLELNDRGYLNGHTPFSALLAFTTLLGAVLTGSKDIALSNEGSANEATIKGTEINHQYSKSISFEEDFREYTHRYISTELNYFSFLRPLQEIQIASLFSRYPKYYSDFKSCNVGSKTDSWCGQCAKCLFAYIILAPFIAQDKMMEIFGADLLNDVSLLPYFDELCGISANKPFECIGTIDEVNLAIQLTIKQRSKLPALLEHYQNHCKAHEFNQSEIEHILHTISTAHHLPDHYLQLIKDALHD